jgi:hypothetical protein
MATVEFNHILVPKRLKASSLRGRAGRLLDYHRHSPGVGIDGFNENV